LGGRLGRAFLSDEVSAVYRLAPQVGSQRMPDGRDVVLLSEAVATPDRQGWAVQRLVFGAVVREVNGAARSIILAGGADCIGVEATEVLLDGAGRVRPALPTTPQRSGAGTSRGRRR